MGGKNYLKDLEPYKLQRGKSKTSWREYWHALRNYLRRPKTLFDLQDRSRFIILLLAVIILLQKVVEMLAD